MKCYRSLAVLGLLVWPALAQAQSKPASDWMPTETIRLITPFAPGGSVDLMARTIGSKLSASLGKPVIIENKPGANGAIALPEAARAKPDGHTIAFVTTTIAAVNPALYKNLPYDVLRDFEPIGTINEVTTVLTAPPSFPANNVQELIKLAKSKPGDIFYASSGTGVFSHLIMEMLKSNAKIDIVHVPYKGEALAVQDLVAGRAQVGNFTLTSSLPLIEAGKLKALGVPSDQRVGVLPGVPTFREQGLSDFGASLWYGLLAPKGTPPEVVAKLNKALNAALTDPDVVKLFATHGLTALPSTPAEHAARIRADLPKYKEIIDTAGIRIE